MGISRKDTIIVAVVVNVALLVALFATATKIEEERSLKQAEALLQQEDDLRQGVDRHMLAEAEVEQTETDTELDEIDKVLHEYAEKQKQVVVVADKEEKSEKLVQTDQLKEINLVQEKPQTSTVKKEIASEFIIVKVKKGDVLSKIAKAHHALVDDIIQMNQLQSTKLKIGQSLKIPVKKKPSKGESRSKADAKIGSEIATATPELPAQKTSSKANVDSEYYVIKSGDNPWKIARKFNIEFDDLLKLNNLDEEKARNLKIGQKIRIR